MQLADLGDIKIDLASVALIVGLTTDVMKVLLATHNVLPVQDCTEPKFCLYWLSEVEVTYPSYNFRRDV